MTELQLREVAEAAQWQTGPACGDAVVLYNMHHRDRYWRMRLQVPGLAGPAMPGQFAMLTVARPGEAAPPLPRPMAVFDTGPGNEIEIVYGVVGSGTRRLTGFRAGERLLTVVPLGRGFAVPAGTRRMLLLGRGIGTCSLTLLAARAVAEGVDVTAVASGRHGDAVVGEDFYRECGATVIAVHDRDGSSDVGWLDRMLSARFDGDPPEFVAACGSRRLRALAGDLGRRWRAEVQVAMEAHMACGLGYCHGCSTGSATATSEAPLVCRDGPVFRLVPVASVRDGAAAPASTGASRR